MDEFEGRLTAMIVAQVSSDDSRDGYAVATGMRGALELYSGPERARRLLVAAGHDF